MLLKSLAGGLLAIVLAALTTLGVVYYTEYSNPAAESAPCRHATSIPMSCSDDCDTCCDEPPCPACAKPLVPDAK